MLAVFAVHSSLFTLKLKLNIPAVGSKLKGFEGGQVEMGSGSAYWTVSSTWKDGTGVLCPFLLDGQSVRKMLRWFQSFDLKEKFIQKWTRYLESIFYRIGVSYRMIWRFGSPKPLFSFFTGSQSGLIWKRHLRVSVCTSDPYIFWNYDGITLSVYSVQGLYACIHVIFYIYLHYIYLTLHLFW